VQHPLARDPAGRLESGCCRPGGAGRRHDRRSYAVTITDLGRDRLAEAQASVPAFLDDTFQALTPGERDRLAALLGV
jgi:hypothetical protein